MGKIHLYEAYHMMFLNIPLTRLDKQILFNILCSKIKNTSDLLTKWKTDGRKKILWVLPLVSNKIKIQLLESKFHNWNIHMFLIAFNSRTNKYDPHTTQNPPRLF